MNEDGTNKPQSFLDFRSSDSIELVRLDEGRWDDIEDYVKVDDYSGRTRISVCGRVRARTRRKSPVLVGYIRVEIVPNSLEQLEVCLHQIRVRIAPWNLLLQEVKDVANFEPSLAVEDFKSGLNRLVRCAVDAIPSSITRLSRRRCMLPAALCRIGVLQRDVLGSLMEMMKPSHGAKDRDIYFVFKVLKQSVCVKDVAETQLLRGRTSQIMNFRGLKKLGRRVEELETMAVIASNISRTCAVNKKMNQLGDEL